jgi:predicted metal-dependent hydrolase
VVDFKAKKQAPKDGFMQLVFDFLAPLSAKQRGGVFEGSAIASVEPPTQKQESPSSLDYNAHPTPSLFQHPGSTHALEIKGVEVHYLFKRAKRKTIGMLVSKDGLEVRAPRWVSLSQVQMALKEREDWILKQFSFMEQKLEESKRSEVRIESGCICPVLSHGVQWIFHGLTRPASKGVSSFASTLASPSLSQLQRENTQRLRSPLEHIEVQRFEAGQWFDCTCSEWLEFLQESAVGKETHFKVYLPIESLYKQLSAASVAGVAGPGGAEKTCAKQWIDAVMIHLARRILEPRVAYFAGILGVHPSALSLGQAKSRWGSAGSNGAIRLNWHLVHLPMALLDYVVAHELCHLKEMNHGPAFWAEMQALMPDFAARRRELKKVSIAQWV